MVFELEERQAARYSAVVESGFDNVPPGRRVEAFRMNSGGWDQQMENIKKHVAKRVNDPRKLRRCKIVRRYLRRWAMRRDYSSLRSAWGVRCRSPSLPFALRLDQAGRHQTFGRACRRRPGARRKVGRERLWEFEPAQMEEARRSLEVIGSQWDHALAKG